MRFCSESSYGSIGIKCCGSGGVLSSSFVRGDISILIGLIGICVGGIASDLILFDSLRTELASLESDF